MQDGIPDFDAPSTPRPTVIVNKRRRVFSNRSANAPASVMEKETPAIVQPQVKAPETSAPVKTTTTAIPPRRRRTISRSDAEHVAPPSNSGALEETLTILPILEENLPEDIKPLLVKMNGLAYVRHDRSGHEISSGVVNGEVDVAKFIFEPLGRPNRPRLVTYGGRTLLLPRLRLIAMREGINGHDYLTAGDRWNGYEKRFSQVYHVDMMEALSMDGATQSLSLNEALSFMGIEAGSEPKELLNGVYTLFRKHYNFIRSERT